MITSNIDTASKPVQAKPFDTGDRVMLNSQLIITMPNRGRTYRFSPEDGAAQGREQFLRRLYQGSLAGRL